MTAGADDARALSARIREHIAPRRRDDGWRDEVTGEWVSFPATVRAFIRPQDAEALCDALDALAARVEELERQAAEREKWYEHVTASWKAEEEDWVAERDSLDARLRDAQEALRPIVREYDLWSEDANDGEFRLWDLDRLVMAIVNARAALRAADPERSGHLVNYGVRSELKRTARSTTRREGDQDDDSG